MAKTPKNEAPVTGNVMMYDDPQPLTKDKHAKFGVKQVEKPFTFMEKSHFMPLTAPEFGLCQFQLPDYFCW